MDLWKHSDNTVTNKSKYMTLLQSSAANNNLVAVYGHTKILS